MSDFYYVSEKMNSLVANVVQLSFKEKLDPFSHSQNVYPALGLHAVYHPLPQRLKVKAARPQRNNIEFFSKMDWKSQLN